MARNIIDLPTLGDDGKLYRDTAVDMVESLIPNPWESCHAPDLLELENGDLLCCWFAGSREGNADISIAVARLPADAEQWEQPVIVSDDPTRSEQNPSLFQNPNGDIWLMYTAQAAKKPDDNSDDSLQGTAEIRRKISRDGGPHMGPHRGCIYPSRLFLPPEDSGAFQRALDLQQLYLCAGRYPFGQRRDGYPDFR